MAKYKAQPNYAVVVNDKKTIEFDAFGNYSTDNKDEIAFLDKLVPRYINKEKETTKKESEPATEAKSKKSASASGK